MTRGMSLEERREFAARFDDKPHRVYRIFNEAGELLYIGCTHSLRYRLAAHRHGSLFRNEIHSWTEEEYPNKAAARRAEAKAIRAERPIYNVQHQAAS